MITRNLAKVLLPVGLIATLSVASAEALAQRGDAREDRGVYYPSNIDSERFSSVFEISKSASVANRRSFVDTLSTAILDKASMRSIVVFVTGEQADRLIVASYDNALLATEYQARSFLAGLVPLIRVRNLATSASDVLSQSNRFGDLAKAMGFTSVTVTNSNNNTLMLEID